MSREKRGRPKINFNILIEKDEGLWVAHCLELDIVATSPNMREVTRDIRDLIRVQVESAFTNNNLDHLFRPAPKEVWEKLSKCRESHERAIRLTSSAKVSPPQIVASECLV